MKLVFSLTLMYVSNVFSLSRIFEALKQSPKKALRTLAMLGAFLYLVIFFGAMYVTVISSLYQVLTSIGQQDFLLSLIALSAMLATFIFGFMNAVSTYSIESGEENLLSLPLMPIQLFTAKLFSTYIVELPLGFLLICIGGGIYGYHESLLASPLFYLTLLTGSLAIPLFSISLCYLLLVLILRLFRGIKNKKLLMGFTSVAVMVLFLSFNFFYQQIVRGFSQEMIAQILIDGHTSSVGKGFAALKNLVRFLPPIQWFNQGLSAEQTGSAVLSLLLLLTTSFVVMALFLFLLSPLYIQSIIGFNDISVKKMKTSNVRSFIKNRLRRQPLFKALLLRDIKMVLREPIFFINGPLIIILLPVVMLTSIIGNIASSSTASGSSLEETIALLKQTANSLTTAAPNGNSDQFLLFCIAGIVSTMGIFMASATNLSATAISREGKNLQILTAMPVPFKTLLRAKLCHSMLYALLAALIAASFVLLLPIDLFSFSNKLWAMCLVIALVLTASLFLHSIHLLIDLRHPKLDWESPRAAVKQNMNAFIASLSTMFFVTALVLLGIFLLPKKPVSIVCTCLLLGVLDAVLISYLSTTLPVQEP